MYTYYFDDYDDYDGFVSLCLYIYIHMYVYDEIKIVLVM